MYTYIDKNDKRLSNIFLRSRYESGKTKEYVSREMNVTRKTVSNWENGKSSPTFEQTFRWFEVIGVNPFPYFFQYMFPHLENIKGGDSDTKIENALNDIITTLSPRQRRMMLYILIGSHGSDFDSILNLTVAHLQTNLRDRIVVADAVLDHYYMTENKTCPENIQPDLSQLQKSIELAKKSYYEGKNAYVLRKE